VKKCNVFFVLFVSLFLGFKTVSAKTVFVTNNLDLPLRSEESNKSKIISILQTGTPLTVISENIKTGFTQVELKSGMKGFIATRFTMPEPPNNMDQEASTKNIIALQSENDDLRRALEKAKAVIAPGSTLEKSLSSERDRLDRELTELKKTAANQVQIKNERDSLQERVVNVERELEQVKLENHALKDGSSQDWFLYGGFLALAGVILGFILPKLAWRRNSSWDRL
jgi:SH3 domain protein